MTIMYQALTSPCSPYVMDIARQFHDVKPEFPGGADDRKKLVHIDRFRYKTVRMETVALHNVPVGL